MKVIMNSGRSLLIALVFVTISVAGEKSVDLSGKWFLDSSEEGFLPLMQMENRQPGRGPMGGGAGSGKGRADNGGAEGEIATILETPTAKDLTLTIAQSAAEIRIELNWTRDSHPLSALATFTPDGKESRTLDESNMTEFKSKAGWRNGKLVIEGIQRSLTGDRSLDVRIRQEFSLSRDGRVLAVRTTQESRRGRFFIKQTFKRP